MVFPRLLPAACGCFALLLACPASAASDITTAAIAMGRLYVLGTTDRPHTKVRLEDKFDTVSDDKGLFQFELVYHPANCIVRAVIDSKTVEAVVGQCGEMCKPAQQTNVPQMPRLGSETLSPGQPLAAPILPARPGGMALVPPEGPRAATALPPPAAPSSAQPQAEKRADPLLHAPLPPPRPKDSPSVAARPVSPAPAVKPTAVKPRSAPTSSQKEKSSERPADEPLEAPNRSDVY